MTDATDKTTRANAIHSSVGKLIRYHRSFAFDCGICLLLEISSEGKYPTHELSYQNSTLA
jgi:hypothetical protein